MQRTLTLSTSILSVVILILYNYYAWENRKDELSSASVINLRSPPLNAYFGPDILDDQVHYSSWWIPNSTFLFYFLFPSSILLGLLNIVIFVQFITFQKLSTLIQLGHWLLTLIIFRLNSWIFTRGFGWKYPILYVYIDNSILVSEERRRAQSWLRPTYHWALFNISCKPSKAFIH